jgi:hypothetical protein
MAGKWYMNSIRLSKAYCEGFDADVAEDDPFTLDTPESDAWVAGFVQACPGEPDFYGGVDWHTRNYWCAPGGPGGN